MAILQTFRQILFSLAAERLVEALSQEVEQFFRGSELEFRAGKVTEPSFIDPRIFNIALAVSCCIHAAMWQPFPIKLT
jgi:hypothetical protein